MKKRGFGKLQIYGLLVWIGGAVPAASAEDVCSQPGVVFCNGFEGGASAVTAAWDGDGTAAGHLVADPGPFNTPGNQAVLIKGMGASWHKTFPGQDIVYARWYQKWEPGYAWGPNHGSGLGAEPYWNSGNCPPLDTAAQAWLDASQTGAGLHLYAYYNGQSTNYCFGDIEGVDDFPLQTGVWYCIEEMIDLGTPTPGRKDAGGLMKYWIDGKEYGPIGGLWLRSDAAFKLSTLEFEHFRHDGYTALGYLIDDVVISTQRIGPQAGRCGGSIGITYGIRATEGDGGSLSPGGVVMVNPGADQTFAVTPYSGYQIKQVLVDGTNLGALSSYTFSNVTDAHTLAVTFETGGDTLILDNNSPGTWHSGPWSLGYGEGFYGLGNYYYEMTNAPGQSFAWTGKLPPGVYQVYAWWVANSGRPTNVSYAIVHAVGTSTVDNVNQTLNGSRWNWLGQYAFAGDCQITLTSGSDGTEGACADAIRLVRVGGLPNRPRGLKIR